jgi:hypothetical protein
MKLPPTASAPTRSTSSCPTSRRSRAAPRRKVFHTVENFFPWYGKRQPDFSMAWKAGSGRAKRFFRPVKPCGRRRRDFLFTGAVAAYPCRLEPVQPKESHEREFQFLEHGLPAARPGGAADESRSEHPRQDAPLPARAGGFGADPDGRRQRAGVRRLPRAAQLRTRAHQGRRALSSGRDARRGQGAGDADDLEVRGGRPALRRGQGRHRLRSGRHEPGRN